MVSPGLGDAYQYSEVSWFLGSFPVSHRQAGQLAREEGAKINLSKKLTYLLRWTNSRISVFSSPMALNSHGSIPRIYVVGSDKAWILKHFQQTENLVYM